MMFPIGNSLDGARGTGHGARGNRSSHAPRPTPHAPKLGLTLVEILVSIAILASAAVLVMQAFARSAYALTLAGNRLSAYAFAAAKMAELELGFAHGVLPETLEGHLRMGHDQFAWRVETAPVLDEPELEMVTLVVAWGQGPRTYESQVGALRRVPKTAP